MFIRLGHNTPKPRSVRADLIESFTVTEVIYAEILERWGGLLEVTMASGEVYVESVSASLHADDENRARDLLLSQFEVSVYHALKQR